MVTEETFPQPYSGHMYDSLQRELKIDEAHKEEYAKEGMYLGRRELNDGSVRFARDTTQIPSIVWERLDRRGQVVVRRRFEKNKTRKK